MSRGLNGTSECISNVGGLSQNGGHEDIQAIVLYEHPLGWCLLGYRSLTGFWHYNTVRFRAVYPN